LYKDTNGGDAGCVEKKSQYHPFIHFVRSQYCGKYQNSILHADVGTVGGSSKMMKEYNITTGFIIAYKNTFDVDIYNIQRPSKDACPENYSQEYYSKIMVARKLNANKIKKNEKTLSQLVREIQLNDGKAPEEGSVPKTPTDA
tara:strand:+ start:53 stop:481 length:429 start_codon:yes stop_codon:yes gene_type:complete